MKEVVPAITDISSDQNICGREVLVDVGSIRNLDADLSDGVIRDACPGLVDFRAESDADVVVTVGPINQELFGTGVEKSAGGHQASLLKLFR